MSTELAVQEKPFLKASTALALTLGIEASMMIDTIKAQCFKSVSPDKVSDEQLAAYISVAQSLPGINPLLPGMLYAYPEKNGGITPIIGPDGIFTLLSNNPAVCKQDDNGPAWYAEAGVENGEQVVTAYINHKFKGLMRKKIYVKEWIVSSNPNWQSRPRHMAEIRALKQCARMVIHGLPMDEDELVIAGLKNVTGSDPESPSAPIVRPDPAALKKGKQGASAAKETGKPADGGAIDTTATVVPEKPAEKTAEPAVDKSQQASNNPKAVTSLERKERKTIKGVKIESAKYENFGADGAEPVHGCRARVSGAVIGDVFDTKGGQFGDGVGDVLAIWRTEGTVTLELLGAKSSTLGPIMLVEKITVEAETADMP